LIKRLEVVKELDDVGEVKAVVAVVVEGADARRRDEGLSSILSAAVIVHYCRANIYQSHLK
jgi:hypothetical protein